MREAYVILFMLLGLGEAQAANSNCATIREDDLRHFCRAESGNPSECASIRNNDQRHYCRAVVGGSSSECSSIRNNDLRALCRARTD